MANSQTVMRVLVVEDEAHLAAGLKLNFEIDGFQADVASTVRDAGRLLLRPGGYEVIILDVMLPDSDGFTFCQRIRESGNFTPVIMLTVRSSPADRVRGLEAGADDYVAKPFEFSELVARARSVIRRRRWDRDGATQDEGKRVLSFGNAVVDFDTHEVLIGGERGQLTRLELDLLFFFSENAGRVVARAELLERVWGLANAPNTRTVDNFIGRLRKHFETDPSRPVHFLSVRGAGYKFVPDAGTG